MKVRQPNVLNDFSFYRRNFTKMLEFDIHLPVLEQEANVISMFLAQPSPLIMGLAKKVPDAEAAQFFANIANALCRALTSEFQDEATLDFACKAMACATVIFDQSTQVGVFGSKEIKLKAIVDALGGYVCSALFLTLYQTDN